MERVVCAGSVTDGAESLAAAAVAQDAGVRVVWARPVGPQKLLRARVDGMERLLEAGHLDRLERALGGRMTGEALAAGNPDWAARVEALRVALPEARVREAAAGGPGSLVDHAHPLTVYFEQCRRAREELAARRGREGAAQAV